MELEFKDRKVNILGTEYKIKVEKISENDYMRKNNFAGYCSEYSKTIVIGDVNEKEYFDFESDLEKKASFKETLRHEIIHAFLDESGLSRDSDVPRQGWAKNEEMVDWIAIQSPKIFEAFRQVGCLGEEQKVICEPMDERVKEIGVPLPEELIELMEKKKK